jgi:hypothetical protein
MIAIAAALPAAEASAQQVVYHPSFTQVPVQVKASVGGRCGFATNGAPNGSVSQADVDVNGLNHDFAFQLDCTSPLRVAVVSTNGALKTGGTAPTGYANTAPYSVTLNLVGNTGSTQVTENATCAVATLVAGSSCSFVGPSSATKGLRLAAPSMLQTGSFLRVTAPAYAGSNALVSGTYVDTLTVTISASP